MGASCIRPLKKETLGSNRVPRMFLPLMNLPVYHCTVYVVLHYTYFHCAQCLPPATLVPPFSPILN